MVQRAQTLPLARSRIGATPTAIAVGSMLMAVVALSLAAIFIRLSEIELGPFATIFHRFWMAWLMLKVVDWLNSNRAKVGDRADAKEREDYTPRDYLLLVSAGIAFWGCLALWAWSLTQTGVANSTILHNLTPLFTALGAWAIFGQYFDSHFLGGLVIATIGATALGLDDLQSGTDNFAGDVASLLSAVFSAANLMIIERLRTKFTATNIISWCCLVGAILSLPVMLLTEDRFAPISLSGWLSVIGLAFVCQVVGQGLQAFSLKKLSSSVVGAILLLDPVLAAVIAWGLFSESLSLFNWVAFCVVLFGIYLAKSSPYAAGVLTCEIDPTLVEDEEPEPETTVAVDGEVTEDAVETSEEDAIALVGNSAGQPVLRS